MSLKELLLGKKSQYVDFCQWNVEPFNLPARLSLSSFFKQMLLPYTGVNLNLLLRNW